jgi:hypothetical protein
MLCLTKCYISTQRVDSRRHHHSLVTALCPFRVARFSTVLPSLSFASTSAPFSSSSLANASCTLSAAQCSVVESMVRPAVPDTVLITFKRSGRMENKIYLQLRSINITFYLSTDNSCKHSVDREISRSNPCGTPAHSGDSNRARDRSLLAGCHFRQQPQLPRAFLILSSH